MPRVSVLLTCYNHLDYLKLAVEALRQQTFRDFEVLALDDGSTDGSREWLAEQKDLRVYCHPKNLGTYGNLNFGIDHALGDLLCVLNDDDLWAPEKLEHQLMAMDGSPNVGLVHTSGWFIDGRGERIEGSPLGFPWPKTQGLDALAQLIHHNQIITSSAMFRKECVQKVGPFEPSFYGCGDWQMWLRIAEHYDVIHVDRPLTFYRVHDTNACRNDAEMERDSLQIRTWIANESDRLRTTYPDRQGLKDALIHNYACLGTELMWSGQRAEGRAMYLKSFKMKPTRLKSVARWVASFLPRKMFRRLR